MAKTFQTVKVQFTPRFAGNRRHAVKLASSGNDAIVQVDVFQKCTDSTFDLSRRELGPQCLEDGVKSTRIMGCIPGEVKAAVRAQQASF